jgi:hypothetical protein
MDRTTVERQKLIEEVSALPSEALAELASFLHYLHYKSIQEKLPAISAVDVSATIDKLNDIDQSQTGLREKSGILVFETEPLGNIDFNALIEQSRDEYAWEQSGL